MRMQVLHFRFQKLLLSLNVLEYPKMSKTIYLCANIFKYFILNYSFIELFDKIIKPFDKFIIYYSAINVKMRLKVSKYQVSNSHAFVTLHISRL